MVELIFTYKHQGRTLAKSDLEPLLYVRWLKRVPALHQQFTDLPLALYVPFYIDKRLNCLESVDIIAVSSVLCQCYVHSIYGEPRPQRGLRLPVGVAAEEIIFLNLAITLGPVDFSERVLNLHSQGYSFTPDNYREWGVPGIS